MNYHNINKTVFDIRKQGAKTISPHMAAGIESIFKNGIHQAPAFTNLGTNKFRTSHKLSAHRIKRVAIVFSTDERE